MDSSLAPGASPDVTSVLGDIQALMESMEQQVTPCACQEPAFGLCSCARSTLYWIGMSCQEQLAGGHHPVQCMFLTEPSIHRAAPLFLVVVFDALVPHVPWAGGPPSNPHLATFHQGPSSAPCVREAPTCTKSHECACRPAEAWVPEWHQCDNTLVLGPTGASTCALLRLQVGSMQANIGSLQLGIDSLSRDMSLQQRGSPCLKSRPSSGHHLRMVQECLLEAATPAASASLSSADASGSTAADASAKRIDPPGSAAAAASARGGKLQQQGWQAWMSSGDGGHFVPSPVGSPARCRGLLQDAWPGQKGGAGPARGASRGLAEESWAGQQPGAWRPKCNSTMGASGGVPHTGWAGQQPGSQPHRSQPALWNLHSCSAHASAEGGAAATLRAQQEDRMAGRGSRHCLVRSQSSPSIFEWGLTPAEVLEEGPKGQSAAATAALEHRPRLLRLWRHLPTAAEQLLRRPSSKALPRPRPQSAPEVAQGSLKQGNPSVHTRSASMGPHAPATGARLRTSDFGPDLGKRLGSSNARKRLFRELLLEQACGAGSAAEEPRLPSVHQGTEPGLPDSRKRFHQAHISAGRAGSSSSGVCAAGAGGFAPACLAGAGSAASQRHLREELSAASEASTAAAAQGLDRLVITCDDGHLASHDSTHCLSTAELSEEDALGSHDDLFRNQDVQEQAPVLSLPATARPSQFR